MKIQFIVILLFVSLTISAQIELEKKFNQDICNCLDSKTKKNTINKTSFTECFQQGALINSEAIIKETISIYGDSTYESGYKLGQSLAQKAMLNLVSTCHSYFLLADALRYSKYETMDQDSLKTELARIQSSKEEVDTDKKAELYFALKEYDKALEVVEAELVQDPESVKYLYLKGWIFEIMTRYDEAIDTYDQVAIKTGSNNFYIYSEVAKRKKKGDH